MSNSAKGSFIEHLEALRSVLLKTAVCFLLLCIPGGKSRARLLVALKNYGSTRKTANYPVSLWKIISVRTLKWRIFGYHRSVPCYLTHKLSVLLRIYHGYSAAKDSHGITARCQCAACRYAVDTESHTADDNSIRSRKLIGYCIRRIPSVFAHPSCSNHTYTKAVIYVRHFTEHIENSGRILYSSQS